VATVSRLFRIIGLFCRISSLLYGSFAKETYNFKEPTNRSHPIAEKRQNTRKGKRWKEKERETRIERGREIHSRVREKERES